MGAVLSPCFRQRGSHNNDSEEKAPVWIFPNDCRADERPSNFWKSGQENGEYRLQCFGAVVIRDACNSLGK